MWKVLVEESALKFIESLGKHAEKIKENLRLLKESPYPEHGLGDKKEIKGALKTAFRMRIGDYRAFYVIEDASRTVKVTEVMTAEAAHKKYGRS